MSLEKRWSLNPEVTMEILKEGASLRKSVLSNLEKSIWKNEPQFAEISQRLHSLKAEIQAIRAQRDAVLAVVEHINDAVIPATAVVKVFDAIRELDKFLSNPQSDPVCYLGVLKMIEEPLRLLEENCEISVQWLADIVEYLEDHRCAVSKLKKELSGLCLRKLPSKEDKARLDGGLLVIALDRLENEFRRLLTENSVPLPKSHPPLLGDQACIAPPLPFFVIRRLHAILGQLIANNRLEKCISIYVEVRSSNVRASLQAFNLDYLEISVSEFNDVLSKEGHIVHQWGRDLEFAVKHLFEAEYELCNDVFERLGLDVGKSCFAKIATQAGILAFLQFGKTVTESKKSEIKLLELLDIFSSLDKIRLDFARLFGGTACAEIQNLTRDLIKRVIEGACEMFWEILPQVELQRQTPPPSDGSVPRLVMRITGYCNKLLGDDYKQILTRVLVIEGSWKHKKFQKRLLIDEFLNIMKAVELNVKAWSKGYQDSMLACVFLMNNHWHLYKHLKGTKLGTLLGDSWLREHERYKDFYSAFFLKESWSKLPALLSREGLILFSGGGATARDLVKKRLKAFNEAFDDMYKKQSNWVMLDKDLQEKTCQLIIQAIVPVYGSYMQDYGGPLVEQDASASKYVKYTVQSLEKMLNSLFHPRPVRHGSFKVRQAAA